MTNSTKDQIQTAIEVLTSGENPVCTAAEIADWTDLSKVTVNKYVGEVVEGNHEIKSRTVGQTVIYYTHYNRLAEIPFDKDVLAKGRLSDTHTEAEYYALTEAPADSEFDAVVSWFDAAANKLENYRPEPEEMGEAISGYGPEPLAIEFYSEQEDP